MSEYQIGDDVEANLPGGWVKGRVVEVMKNYSWSDETKYEIHGEKLVTITSARNMRAAA